jgi:hypothetical protein
MAICALGRRIRSARSETIKVVGCPGAYAIARPEAARDANSERESRVLTTGGPVRSGRQAPKLIEDDYLGDVARAVFERIGKAAPVQVVGGLSIAQAKSLAKAGLRAFVISGNMGLPDGNARYNLPPAEIQRLVAGFIVEVSGA